MQKWCSIPQPGHRKWNAHVLMLCMSWLSPDQLVLAWQAMCHWSSFQFNHFWLSHFSKISSYFTDGPESCFLWCLDSVLQDSPDEGFLRVGETVAPLYVDQSRDALDSEKSVFDEITGGQEELMLGMFFIWRDNRVIRKEGPNSLREFSNKRTFGRGPCVGAWFWKLAETFWPPLLTQKSFERNLGSEKKVLVMGPAP